MAADLDCNFLILHQGAVQPRGIAVDENRQQQIHRRSACIGRRWRLVGKLQEGCLCLATHDHNSLFELLRLDSSYGGGGRLPRYGLEVLAREREYFLGYEVASENECQVVGSV